MNIYSIIFLIIIILLSSGGICLYILNMRIQSFEKKLLHTFASRSDLFPALYEVTKDLVIKHSEIFAEVMNLRKKEFSLMLVSNSMEGFLDVESHIHHEINFIFQVCNKNPKLLKEKKFLYIRDVIIQESSDIARMMKKYRKIIDIYNKIITYKNYSVIWLLLPFSKKTAM